MGVLKQEIRAKKDNKQIKNLAAKARIRDNKAGIRHNKKASIKKDNKKVRNPTWNNKKAGDLRPKIKVRQNNKRAAELGAESRIDT